MCPLVGGRHTIRTTQVHIIYICKYYRWAMTRSYRNNFFLQWSNAENHPLPYTLDIREKVVVTLLWINSYTFSTIDDNYAVLPDHCKYVRCSGELCPDGSLAPVPRGECCPDRNLCPVNLKCKYVTCEAEYCSDGSVAPVPKGECCPDRSLCRRFCGEIFCIPQV